MTATQQAYKTNNSPSPPDGGLRVESSDSVNVQRLSLRRSASDLTKHLNARKSCNSLH